MLFRLACFCGLLLSQATIADPLATRASVDLDNATDIQKLSYLLGLDMYEKRSKQGFTLDPEMVARAIRDEQAGIKPELSSAEYMRTFTLKQEIITNFEARWQALSEKNLAEGKAFLARKALEPGVISTDSGLLYRILRSGAGEKPRASDIARVHYRGTLLNGDEFDSSFKRGKPGDFPVGKLRPAMKETLLLMREGAKWVFYAPPHLGYGEDGAGPIGPNETLVTEIELLEILK